MTRYRLLPALIGVLCAGFLPDRSIATTRIVPDQFPMIQAAMVASAANGDSILVRPGTYMEAIDFLEKEVVLRSTSGPEVTIIDATGRPAAVVFLTGVGSGARVEGFTLRKGSGSINGQLAWGGGGVHCSLNVGAGPIIEGNWITDNTASYGGGVLAWGPAQIIRNRITNNQSLQGAGVCGFNSGVGTEMQLISENEIFGNETIGGTSQRGGGIYVNHLHLAIINRNVIACNESEVGGGCYVAGGDNGKLVEGNTIFANWGRSGVGGIFLLYNTANVPLEVTRNAIVYNFGGGGMQCLRHGLGSTGLFVECNDIFGNNPDVAGEDCGEVIGVNNNIREDPLMGSVLGCPPAVGALCLTEESPLLPENSPPGCGLIGARGLCSQIGIADETSAPAAAGNRVSAQPNPFTTRTTLVIDLVAPVEIHLRITNALGRVVTEQSLGTMHAGRHRWTWDGRDATGRRAPAGVYYAEVQTGGRAIVTRLMVLR